MKMAEEKRIENAKFLGSVVIPCSLTTLSKGEIHSAIYGGVVKVISRFGDVAPAEHKIRIRAEVDCLVGRSIMKPSIGKNCDLYLTSDGIRTFTSSETNESVPLFDHKFVCISSTGTNIPNHDNIFVYVAQLAKNGDDYPEELPKSDSRQLFVFEFAHPLSATKIFQCLNARFQAPRRGRKYISG
jgi:hypothetical protein